MFRNQIAADKRFHSLKSLSLLFLAFIALLSICAIAQAIPTTAELSSKPHEGGFTISPDGKYLASIRQTPYEFIIALRDLERNRHVEPISLGGIHVNNLVWATNERLILEILGGLAAINIDGSQKAFLAGAELTLQRHSGASLTAIWEIIHPLPDDPVHVLASNSLGSGNVMVYKVNIYSGDKRLIVGDRIKAQDWRTDRLGRIRLGLKMEDARIKFLYRRHERAPWKAFDAFVEDGSMAFDQEGSEFFDQRLYIMGFDYDPMIVYISSSVGRNTFAIQKFDLLTQSVARTVLEDEIYDVGDPNLNNTKLLFLDSEKKLVGIRYTTSKPKVRWHDSRFRKYQAYLDEEFKGYFNEMISWNNDASSILVYSWNDRDGGDLRIYRPERNQLNQIASFTPGLKDERMSRTRNIHFTARDGLEIYGYLNMPPGKSRGPVPMILYAHGGPWARDDWGYDPFVQFLATRGYGVLRVNFRGSSGLGWELQKAGVGQVGDGMIDDMADGVKWAIEKGYADPDKIGITGASYGGYATYMGLIRYPELFKAGVSMLGPVDLKRQILWMKGEERLFAYELWRSAVGKGLSDARNKRVSPYYHAEKLAGKPLVMIYGEQDPIVPIEQKDFMVEALDAAGVDYDLIVFPDEGHGFADPANMKRVLDVMGRFFGKNLK